MSAAEIQPLVPMWQKPRLAVRGRSLRSAAIIALWVGIMFDFYPISALGIGNLTRVSPVLFLAPVVLLLVAFGNKSSARGQRVRPSVLLLMAFLTLVGYLISAIRLDIPTNPDTLLFVARIVLLMLLSVTVYQVVRDKKSLWFAYASLVIILAIQTLFSLYTYLSFPAGWAPPLDFYPPWDRSNLAGMYLTILALISGGFALATWMGLGKRLLFAGLAGLFLVALVLTESRGAILFAGVLIPASAFFMMERKWLAPFMLATGVVAWLAFVPQPIKQELGTAVSRDAWGGSGQEIRNPNSMRIGLAVTAFRILADNPVQGIGVDNYKREAWRFVRPGDPTLWRVSFTNQSEFNPHLQFLTTAVEGGVLALLGLLLLVGVITKRLWSPLRRLPTGPARTLVLVSMFTWIAALGGMLWTTPLIFPWFWALLGLWFATIRMAKEEVAEASGSEPHTSSPEGQRIG